MALIVITSPADADTGLIVGDLGQKAGEAVAVR